MIEPRRETERSCVFVAEGSTLANRRDYIIVTKHPAVKVLMDLIPSQHFLCFLEKAIGDQE
jgi:hypothetical protein